MKSILEKIVNYKKEELASLRRKVSLKDVRHQADDAGPSSPFLENFCEGKINIIAEIKKASPSAGIIRENFNPLDIARIYEENGAKALSVLTDEHFFQGSLNHLKEVRRKVRLPCLRKDFTLDIYHIYEARGAGADAILLIASILEGSQLKDFSDLAFELGMVSLFEIHNEKEWEKISLMKPDLVGVNNRDLQSFKIDLETSLRLIPQMQGVSTKISESGIKTHQDILKLQEAGFDGFLIGETFLKEKDIIKMFEKLTGG